MGNNTVGEVQAAYRRKRVKRIKRIIIGTCLVLLLLPTILSIFLMVKVFSLENKIEKITSNQLKIQQEETAHAKEKQKTDAAPEKKKVYLTFDDGPGSQTEKILDVLKKNHVKATFFVTGKEAPSLKKIYKRIVKEGHTLGMHSYSHIYDDVYESRESFETDFEKIYKYLEEVTGERPKWYRFPGGSSNQRTELPISTFIEVLDKKNISYLDWNVISPDISNPSLKKSQIAESIVESVSQFDTSVVLMYDSVDRKMTVKALPLLIKALKKENYELLPVDENTPLIQHNH